MKTYSLIVALCFVASLKASAQKINLEKWVTHVVDSLQKNKADTIEYYHEYCGECDITRAFGDTVKHHNCQIENSWVQIENTIIYKQNGEYFSLAFNCNYPPIRKKLSHIKSLEYFVSIVPALNHRDQTLTALRKHNKFAPLESVDGIYKQAFLYWEGIKQSVYLHDEPTSDQTQLSFLWISKEINLFKLIASELSTN